MAKLSGIQRNVFSLYRGFLREAKRRRVEAEKAGKATSADADILKSFVEKEFRRRAGIDKKEYQLIEHLLRQGTKQLQQLQDLSTTGFHVAGK